MSRYRYKSDMTRYMDMDVNESCLDLFGKGIAPHRVDCSGLGNV